VDSTHADTRRASGENQALDGTIFENVVQIRLVKPAVSMLVENDVARFGRQVRHNLSIPGISNEDPTCRSVWSGDCLTYAQWSMLDPVWSAGRTRIGKIGSKAHFQVNDNDAGAPRCSQDAGGGRNGVSDAGNVDARPSEHPALGTEVILHIDNNHGAVRWDDRESLGLSIDNDLSW
jgi:hypothetical protein